MKKKKTEKCRMLDPPVHSIEMLLQSLLLLGSRSRGGGGGGRAIPPLRNETPPFYSFIQRALASTKRNVSGSKVEEEIGKSN